MEGHVALIITENNLEESHTRQHIECDLILLSSLDRAA